MRVFKTGCSIAGRTRTIVIIFFLMGSMGKNAYAHHLHANAGVGVLTIIPTAFAELQYGEPGNALRINYTASIANPLGDRKYHAVFVAYSFHGSGQGTNRNDYFVNVGRSKTTGGAEPEDDYTAVGFGFEQLFDSKRIFSGFGRYMFGRLAVNVYRHDPKSGTAWVTYEAIPEMSFGLEFF